LLEVSVTLTEQAFRRTDRDFPFALQAELRLGLPDGAEFERSPLADQAPAS
jgi:hypothetical protein